MNERERIIRLWFDMWLKQQDLGIDDILQKMWFIRKAGVQNIRIAKLLSTGLMSGIHGEKSLFGTLSSFSIKVIRLSWNGTSKMK